MGDFDYDSEHRKKRRRREIPPRPVSARLVFDENIKGDAATLSESLAAALSICTSRLLLQSELTY